MCSAGSCEELSTWFLVCVLKYENCCFCDTGHLLFMVGVYSAVPPPSSVQKPQKPTAAAAKKTQDSDSSDSSDDSSDEEDKKAPG